MELRVLKYFLAVAQEENLTRAAKTLLTSQSNLSRQLADLENELGKKLFKRGSRKITLTEEGLYLHKRAKEIIELAERTENELICVEDEKNQYGQFMRFEMLTWAPIDLDGIDTKWLNPEDIRQLNTYHEMVYEKISPYLDEEEKSWLRHYTRPID